MKKLISILFLLPLSAFALDPDATGVERMITFDFSTGPVVDCFDPAETPSCPDITATYCTNLTRSGGQMSDVSGTVNLGKSQRSGLSQIERTGLDDLVRAQARLPEDLRRALTNPIRDLTNVLSRENDSQNWYRDLARARAKIAEKIQDVAKDRADRNLRSRRPTSADRVAERTNQERELNDLVTQARMESSPNWPRLQEIFQHVKRDMISTVNTLPLTETEKADRIARINQTNLTFPFALRVGGVIGQIRENDCRTNMVNAMYIPFSGNLTVCAGLLNAFQSENALYFTLAHELAHSFNLQQLQQRDSYPRGRNLEERLIASNANISCDEFARLKTEVTNGKDNYQCGQDRYNRFMSCLIGNSNPPAEELGQRNMGIAASVLINLDVCQIADRKSGEAYMNPEVFADRNFSRMVSGPIQEYVGGAIPGGRSLLSPVYRLAQELRCSPEGTACPAVLASTAEAIVSEVPTPPACMAASEAGAENEADWFAHKSMIMRLRSVTDIGERRRMIASSMGLFCGFQYQRELPEKEQERLLAEIERLSQLDEEDHHADNVDRINGVMTEEMAGILQCNRSTPNNSQNYQACRL